MRNIYKTSPGRWFFFGTIIENSLRRKSFGVMFSIAEGEFKLCIGYLFGTLWLTNENWKLYKMLKKPLFLEGRGFAEWGRRIGFMINKDYAELWLWWYADINHPDSWRAKYYFFKN